MDSADRFRKIDGLVHGKVVPSWSEICLGLELPDDRWRGHDPSMSVADLRRGWDAREIDWTDTAVLWLGVESDGDRTFLDPVGYGELDETGFPLCPRWHSSPLESEDLTAFSRYAKEEGCYDAYNYGVTLAWAALTVCLLNPSPSGTPVLAGFGGGDWLTLE